VTIYYVDPVNGVDTNNGLGPDASNATNKPWKTVGKGLLAGSPVVSGDTIYLAPGTYRQQVTVGITSPTSQTYVIGDPANTRGFKTATGAVVPGGMVLWTGHTTNDVTSPANNCMDLAGRSFLSFQNIFFVSGFNFVCLAGTATSQNIQFINCALLSSYSGCCRLIAPTNAFGVPFNWLIDRCILMAGTVPVGQGIINLTCALGAGSDYDINFVIKNSKFIAGVGSSTVAHVVVTQSGSGANKGNGAKISNCTFIGGTALYVVVASASTAFPSSIVNSFLYSGAMVAINAGVAGAITEDYNLILSSTPRTNVTAGAHSQSGNAYAPMFWFGQEAIMGLNPKPFGEPMPGSPLLAFGNDGTQPNFDQLNRPKPAGGASILPAIGALERGNSWVRETATFRSGPNAISCTGPAYQDFFLPVEPVATTVSVYMRYDATYDATISRPQFSVLNGEECGVAAASAAMVGASGAWEQVSLTFTPTRQGIVTLRLSSYDNNGAGHVYADDRTGW